MATVLLIVVSTALVLRLAPLALGVLAWGLVGAVALAVLTGQAVPGAVVTLVVALWLGSQVGSRLRRGVWRSGLLRTVGRAAGAIRAAA